MNKKKLKLGLILVSIATNLFGSENDFTSNSNYCVQEIKKNHDIPNQNTINNVHVFNEDQNNQKQKNNINEIQGFQEQSSTEFIKKNYEIHIEEIKNNQEKIGFAKLHSSSTLQKILNQEERGFYQSIIYLIAKKENESTLKLKEYDPDFFKEYDSITIYSHTIEKNLVILYIKGKLADNKLFRDLKNNAFKPCKGKHHPFYCLSKNGEDLEKAKKDLVEAIKKALGDTAQKNSDKSSHKIKNKANIHKRKISTSHEDVSKKTSKKIKPLNKKVTDYFLIIKDKREEIGFAKLINTSRLKEIMNNEDKFFQKTFKRHMEKKENKTTLELKDYEPLIIYNYKLEKDLMIFYMAGNINNDKLFQELRNKAFSSSKGLVQPFYCLSENGENLEEAKKDLVIALETALTNKQEDLTNKKSVLSIQMKNWREIISDRIDKIEFGKFYTLFDLEKNVNYKYKNLSTFFSGNPSFEIRSTGNLPQFVHFLTVKSDKEKDPQKADFVIFAMYQPGQSKVSTLINALKLKKGFKFSNDKLTLYYFSQRENLFDAKKDLFYALRECEIDIQEDSVIDLNNFPVSLQHPGNNFINNDQVIDLNNFPVSLQHPGNNSINNDQVIDLNNFPVHLKSNSINNKNIINFNNLEDYTSNHEDDQNNNIEVNSGYSNEYPNYQENNPNQPEYNPINDNLIIDEEIVFDDFVIDDPINYVDYQENDTNESEYYPNNDYSIIDENICFDDFFINDLSDH